MNNNITGIIGNMGEKENDLINRYVYAVTRRLPLSMRKDVDAELHSIISDTLDARCGDASPTEQDVKVVLTELGTPSELSAKYDPNGERYLISPKYFPGYYMVLKICLACTLAGLLIAAVVNTIIAPSAFLYGDYGQQAIHGFWQPVAKILGMLFSSAISVFGGVTAIFAFLEHKKVSLDGGDDISRLPAVPSDSAKISRAECIVGIVFSALFLLLMCFAPQLLCVITLDTASGARQAVPIFNADVVRGMFPIWAAFFALGAARELVKLFAGVYSIPVMAVTIVTDIASIILAAFAFLPKSIINPELPGTIAEAVAQSGEAPGVSSVQVQDMLSHGFNRVFFAVLLFALSIDIITAVVKTVRHSSSAK